MLAIGLALTLTSATATADVVAIVSSKCAITTLNRSQMADIFLGRVSRFPDGSQAVPVDQAEDSKARETFYAALAGKSVAQMKAYWSKIIFTGRGQPPKAVTSNAEMKQWIVENPRAIGYIDQEWVDDSVRVVLGQPKD